MRTFFVVNPRAANGAAGKRWVELAARIERAVGGHEVGFTNAPMDAERITREALRDGYDCVVAVGGDGTLNEVVNGFFEDGVAVAPDARLAVVPFGTGGDFRRTFDWTRKLEDSLLRLVAGKTRPLDLGRVDFTSHDGARGTRYFANVCSFGASGDVVHQVNRSTKVFGGKASFYLGTFRALRSYQDRPVVVRLDDGLEQEWSVTTVAIANGRYFGGGMCVAPDADPADGFFDITYWSGYGLKDFALKANGVYSGKHVGWSGTKTYRCRRFEARSVDPVRIDVDGEQPGLLPITVTLQPSAVKLVG